MINAESHIASSEPSLADISYDTCDLLLLLAPKRMGYAVIQEENNKLITLKTFQIRSQQTEDLPSEEYQRVMDQESVMQQSFANVKVSIHNRWMTLVPADYFQADKISSFLRFNLEKDQSGILGHCDQISSIDAYNAYGVPEAVAKIVEGYITEPEYRHASSCFLKRVMQEQKTDKGEQVFANIESRHLEIIIVLDGEFRYFNQFHFRTTKDFIYYLLLACDEFDLDRDQLQLTLSGDVEADSAIYQIAYKYIRHIALADRPQNLTYPQEMQQLPEHYHQNLLSLALCG